MENSTCLKDLIEANSTYQYLTDKLDIPNSWLDKNLKEISGYVQIEEKLLQVVFQTYEEGKEIPSDFFDSISVDDILVYLEYSHRWYLTKKLPEIEQSIKFLCQQYRETHPLLIILGTFFLNYRIKLEEHIQYEESFFFPYVKKLSVAKKLSDKNEILKILNSYAVKIFIEIHNDIETDLQEIRKTILKYSGHKKTPLPYRIFLNQLQLFENDLCRHAMLEDYILIPRATQLEAELLTKLNNSSESKAG